MSVAFECIVVAAPKNAVISKLRGITEFTENRSIDVDALGDFSIISWNFSHRREFGVFGEQLCESVSRHFGRAVLVRYDSGTCTRFSSLFTNGVQERSFQLADEKWVLLDDDGHPNPSQGVFLTKQLERGKEYETVENAVQLGLNELGFVNWPQLHDLMAHR